MEKMTKELKQGTETNSLKIELLLSTIKPLHTSCLFGAMDPLATNPDIISQEWDQTGLPEAIQKVAIF